VAAWLVVGASATSFEGLLPQTSDFAEYVGKFCYDYSNQTWSGLNPEVVGNVKLDITRESSQPVPRGGKLYFLIFDDEKGHWKHARRHWQSSTCEEKKAESSLVTEVEVEEARQTSSYLIHIRERIRPRFWYFTFVACGIDLKDTPIRYSVHATNDIWGWQSEFSLDHIGLFKVYVIFTIAFCLAALATAWASRWRAAAQDPPLREHPYIQLLTLAYIASAACCGLFLLHYALFMHNGFGSLRIRFLAVVAGIVANCSIYLIAILSSCGWAISSAVLPNRRCFLGLVTVVGFLTAVCELRAETMVDQSTKLYSYQSSVGEMAIILKIFMFCWFAFQVKCSYEEELQGSRRRFYKYLGFSMGFWAINVPVTVILAFFLNPWTRYKVVTGVDMTARFCGLCLLSQLFCGPLSPITALNTFRPGHVSDAGFNHLSDGTDRNFGSLEG